MKHTWGRSKTIQISIGAPDVPNSDFNFVSAANTNEQNIDLGALIQPFSKVTEIFLHTKPEFTGGVSLSTDVGLTTGADGLISAADAFALDAILQPDTAGIPLVAYSATPGHIWVNSTPGANWSLITGGVLHLHVTILEYHD